MERNQSTTFHTNLSDSLAKRSFPDGRAEVDPRRLPILINAVANQPLAFEVIAINWHFCQTSNRSLDRDCNIGNFEGFEFNLDNPLVAREPLRAKTLESLKVLADAGVLEKLGAEHFILTRMGGEALKRCLPDIDGGQSLSFIGSIYKDKLLEPEGFNDLAAFRTIMTKQIERCGKTQASIERRRLEAFT